MKASVLIAIAVVSIIIIVYLYYNWRLFGKWQLLNLKTLELTETQFPCRVVMKMNPKGKVKIYINRKPDDNFSIGEDYLLTRSIPSRFRPTMPQLDKPEGSVIAVDNKGKILYKPSQDKINTETMLSLKYIKSTEKCVSNCSIVEILHGKKES